MNNTPNNVLYLSGLNGLRAIAALAVVISHIAIGLDMFGLDPLSIFGSTGDGHPRGYLLATYGVTIFFVLSGFLITYLILLEKHKQEIDIKKFYIRRILRIWPLYYFYFALCILAVFYFSKPFEGYLALFYIFFSANVPFILNTGIIFLHHYWSIGVEEQFYIFWPWIMKKTTKIITVIACLIALQLVIRLILVLWFPNSIFTNVSLVNRFDCMMIGGLGAVLYEKKHKLFIMLLDNKISQIMALIILSMLVLNKFSIDPIIGHFIISIMSLTLIIGQINIKNRIINLDHSLFDFLGKISFGIYIYHPLIIFLFSLLLNKLNVDQTLKIAIIYLLIISTTILVAYISYNAFEVKFIKMKNKFAIVKSSGTKNFETK